MAAVALSRVTCGASPWSRILQSAGRAGKAGCPTTNSAGGPHRHVSRSHVDQAGLGTAGRSTMRVARVIQAIDAHCAGEPGRVIVGGVLDVPGATMYEK